MYITCILRLTFPVILKEPIKLNRVNIALLEPYLYEQRYNLYIGSIAILCNLTHFCIFPVYYINLSTGFYMLLITIIS